MDQPKKKTKRPRTKYSNDNLQLALTEISNGMAIKKASKLYNIPRTTLRHKKNNQHSKPMGAPTVLTAEEEGRIVQWIIDLGKMGFPVTKEQLLFSVSKLITATGRVTHFKDGKPGRFWYEAFMRRHPEISPRVTQNLTSGRARITKESIQ